MGFVEYSILHKSEIVVILRWRTAMRLPTNIPPVKERRNEHAGSVTVQQREQLIQLLSDLDPQIVKIIADRFRAALDRQQLGAK